MGLFGHHYEEDKCTIYQRLKCAGKSVSLACRHGINEKHFSNSIPVLSDSLQALVISFSMWICFPSCKYHPQPSLLPSANTSYSACKWTAERTVLVWSEKERPCIAFSLSVSCHSVSGFKQLNPNCCRVNVLNCPVKVTMTVYLTTNSEPFYINSDWKVPELELS